MHLFLLVVFSIVNAIPHKLIKRKITFSKCPTPQVPVNASTIYQVTIDPDLPVSNKVVTITGCANTPVDIIEGDLFVFGFKYINLKNIMYDYTDICSDGKTKCPTKNYDINFNIIAPDLPATYIIAAEIVRPSADNLTLTCGYDTV